MFTNYFAGQRKSSDAQARDILDIVLHGILNAPCLPPPAHKSGRRSR
jgi:hypothetical protein